LSSDKGSGPDAASCAALAFALANAASAKAHALKHATPTTANGQGDRSDAATIAPTTTTPTDTADTIIKTGHQSPEPTDGADDKALTDSII